MIDKTIYQIFKAGSKTYFYSSMFFPTYLKKDVFSLYGFVRKTDNFVDSTPQDKKGFYKFKEEFYNTTKGEKTDDVVIKSFVEMINRKNIKTEWVDAFFKSMEMDLYKKNYETIDETLEYIYGSAEVIGLMMAKIMNLPKESFYYSKYLGRAMQYINFIRDISEDLELGRIYFPSEDLQKHGIMSLEYEYTKDHPEAYTDFLHEQLIRYCSWQKKAEEGYKFIPYRYLIPVKTASEMYHWTAEQIFNKPYIVYYEKIKPDIPKIFTTTLINLIEGKNKANKKQLCIKPKQSPLSQINYK